MKECMNKLVIDCLKASESMRFSRKNSIRKNHYILYMVHIMSVEIQCGKQYLTNV